MCPSTFHHLFIEAGETLKVSTEPRTLLIRNSEVLRSDPSLSGEVWTTIATAMVFARGSSFHPRGEGSAFLGAH